MEGGAMRDRGVNGNTENSSSLAAFLSSLWARVFHPSFHPRSGISLFSSPIPDIPSCLRSSGIVDARGKARESTTTGGSGEIAATCKAREYNKDTIRDSQRRRAIAEKRVSEINEKMTQNDVATQDLNMKIKETKQKLETLLSFPDVHCEKVRKLEALQKMHWENERRQQTIQNNTSDLEDEIESKTQKLEAIFWEDTVDVKKSALQSQFFQIDKLINDSKEALTNLSTLQAQEAELNACKRTLQGAIEKLKDEQQDLQTQCEQNQSIIDDLQNQHVSIRTSIDNYQRDYEHVTLELKYFEKISTYLLAADSLISQLVSLMANDDYINGFLLDVDALMTHLQTLTEVQQVQFEIKKLRVQQRQFTDQLQTVLNQRSSLTIEELNVRLETLRKQISDVTENIRQTSQVLDANNEYTELSDRLARLENSAECLCPTDHTCDEVCYVCPDEKPCKHSAGHDGDHICDKDQHDCPEMCEICKENKCMYAVKHTNPVSHKFSSTHQCKLSVIAAQRLAWN
jgi:DNA repair exonuclease SbcCD ATPase subunit